MSEDLPQQPPVPDEETPDEKTPVDKPAAEQAGADQANVDEASADEASADKKVPDMSPAACADKLKGLFPKLFTGAAKPLKLKIQADIQERAPGLFGKQVLSSFFRRYTGSTSYLIALTRAQTRFDLDGQPAGEIADEHRKAANEELARRRSNQDDRRALEDEQRRNRATLLRDFVSTTLTRSNFCALKGVAEADLDGFLAIAREEAAMAPPPRADTRHDARNDPRNNSRTDVRNNGARTDRPRNDRPGRDRPRDGRPQRPRNP